jgi:hypothetical protein
MMKEGRKKCQDKWKERIANGAKRTRGIGKVRKERQKKLKQKGQNKN